MSYTLIKGAVSEVRLSKIVIVLIAFCRLPLFGQSSTQDGRVDAIQELIQTGKLMARGIGAGQIAGGMGEVKIYRGRPAKLAPGYRSTL